MHTRFYKLHKQENEKNEYTSRTTTTTTTTPEGIRTSASTTRTRTCARAREEEIAEQVSLLAMEYRAFVGPTTDYILAQLRYWLELTSDEVMTYAIHQTGMAPRPSWRYMLAILSRCQRQGVTARQAAADDALTYAGMSPLYQRPEV